MDTPIPVPIIGSPPLGFRFMVVFLMGGMIPNPLDILFQKVSGISAGFETETIQVGGENHNVHRVPTRVQYENLVLERGLMMLSPLAHEFRISMEEGKFTLSNVLVTMLDNSYLPTASWLFMKAYPVKWSISNLDANANSVVIERLELTYQHIKVIRI